MQIEVRACEENPGKPTISVTGAQAGSDQNYYVVEIPAQGTTTVTLTASGQTPCPTDQEKCKCGDRKETPETDGDPKYTFTKPLGNQDPADGPTVKIDITQSTTPNEYKFKVTKIEQKYKTCSQGWTGGVASKSNTQASDEITILVYQIETETVATTPSDRKRTKLGVGEEVKAIFKPASITVNWTTTDASVSPASGSTVTLTAPETAKSPKLTAAFKGISKDTTFTVVAPSSVYIDKTSESNTATSSFLRVVTTADWYIGPEDVNFSKIKIAEQTCTGVASGYLSGKNGEVHTPGVALQVTSSMTAGKGWKCSGYDNISTGSYPPAYSPGAFKWAIPWSYEINGNSYPFATVDHEEKVTINSGKATLTLTKKQLSSQAVQP